MNEMIEIYHEKLLIAPPEVPGNLSGARDQYLKQELSSKRILKENNIHSQKKDNSLIERMELPVNNFLKSLKEIESEFHLVINSIKTTIHEIPDSLDTFGRLMKKTETEVHLNIAGMEFSGHMEENY